MLMLRFRDGSMTVRKEDGRSNAEEDGGQNMCRMLKSKPILPDARNGNNSIAAIDFHPTLKSQ